MCMLHERYPSSLQCVMSLKGQVDKLYLTLNNFDDIPVELKQDWIDVLYVGENTNSEGSFLHMKMVDGEFHLISCDDDIVYPPTYVQDFLVAYSKEDPNTVLTHHGKTIERNEEVVFKVKCLKANPHSIDLDIVGSGVSFVPAGLVKHLPEVILSEENMNDIHLSCLAVKYGYSMKSVPHDLGYLTYVRPPRNTTIWEMKTKELDLSEEFRRILSLYQSS